MKKIFLTLAVLVMAICASAQKNQYIWCQGNLMLGNPIAQIDSVTFGTEDTDSILLYLPRTVIKTIHDTVYITVHDTICPDAIQEDALAGEFSVSPTKKVRFSKGNLQYQASTDTWRFAENQWDIVGDAEIGDVYENGVKCNNYLISDSYTGWIDLFGWGTGDKPTQYDLSADYNTFVDWGNNHISNSSNDIIWRTPAATDFEYLLYERPNASLLYGLCTVNNHFGLVLLPDDWTLDSIKSTYSLEEWGTIEQQGAVFFPAGDSRIEQELDYGSVGGYYWTSTTIYTTDFATTLRIWNNTYYFSQVDIEDYDVRAYGRFVRLVQDVEE